MGDCNHCTHERPFSAEDDITVVFHKVDSHVTNSGDDHDECGEDERTAERIHLQSNCRLSCYYDGDAPEMAEARGGENSPEGGVRKALCPPAFCVSSSSSSEPASGESAREGRSAHALF